MDSLPGGYIDVGTEPADAQHLDSHEVRTVGVVEEIVSSGCHSVGRGKRGACVAICVIAMSGFIRFVAHGTMHAPASAGHYVDFHRVSRDVELPNGSDKLIGVTTAGQQKGYVEWVVANPIVKVRAANSLTANQIGVKSKGAVVRGERHGGWLKLAQERGWMIIALGGHQLLQSRTVFYSQNQHGSCKDDETFLIYDKITCLVAAGYLGYNTSLEDLATYTEKAQLLQGCYAKGKKIVFVPVQASCGHDSCRGNLLERPNSWKPLCSSGAYPRWMSSNGYMDNSAIATRVAVNEKHVSDTFRACPAPTTKCTILWPVSINDFVRIGFGASMGFFGPMRAYVAAIGCKFAVGRGFASRWNGTGWAPFWNEVLPDTTFQARWTNAGDCGGMYWMSHFRPTLVKCEMPRGFISDPKKSAFLRSPQMHGQLFAGWHSLYLQSFGPRLSAYRLPFNHSYAAFHVRTGDKVREIRAWGNRKMFQKSGDTHGLLAILNQYWPHMTSIFIATDDSNAVEQAANSLHDKYNITWSANAARYPGGSPMAQFENHASNDGAVNGVLDDQAGLASAAILIGASDSGFFNVAHGLNTFLHEGMSRPHPWCYDIYKNRICD